MLLNDIVKNANYVTDEELNDANLVGMANSAIAEINAKCSTNLPLFVDENVAQTPYGAFKSTWCLRLIEPYFSYSIAANDTDENSRDFHYNRFLQAISELKDNMEAAIVTEDPETGEDTGYMGDAGNIAIIKAEPTMFHWEGLC